MKTKFTTLLALLLIVALLIGSGGSAVAQTRAPGMIKQNTYLLYPATALTGNTTVYSASPRNVAAGLDASKVYGYANVDIFATIDLDTTGYVTLTLQYSADGTNWTNADFEYASQTSTWNSAGITSTATASTAIATQTYIRYMSADGTEYMSAPTAGEFMRVKIEHSAEVTPTIYATLRN
jgi:hypothetical protein